MSIKSLFRKVNKFFFGRQAGIGEWTVNIVNLLAGLILIYEGMGRTSTLSLIAGANIQSEPNIALFVIGAILIIILIVRNK